MDWACDTDGINCLANSSQTEKLKTLQLRSPVFSIQINSTVTQGKTS